MPPLEKKEKIERMIPTLIDTSSQMKTIWGEQGTETCTVITKLCVRGRAAKHLKNMQNSMSSCRKTNWPSNKNISEREKRGSVTLRKIVVIVKDSEIQTQVQRK